MSRQERPKEIDVSMFEEDELDVLSATFGASMEPERIHSIQRSAKLGHMHEDYISRAYVAAVESDFNSVRFH